jgi:hypothetical protein
MFGFNNIGLSKEEERAEICPELKLAIDQQEQ